VCESSALYCFYIPAVAFWPLKIKEATPPTIPPMVMLRWNRQRIAAATVPPTPTYTLSNLYVVWPHYFLHRTLPLGKC
jgi:hypothetical protein